MVVEEKIVEGRLSERHVNEKILAEGSIDKDTVKKNLEVDLLVVMK